MEKFDAVSFVITGGWTTWYKVFEQDFPRQKDWIDRLGRIGRPSIASGGPIPAEDRAQLDGVYGSVETLCRKYGFATSTVTASRMREAVAKEESRFEHLWPLGIELQGRLRDEMEARLFLSLTPAEGYLYNHPLDGWDTVPTQFPAATYDIEEASRCLALDRSTASAFHSIRSLEAAIRAVARCLRIPDPTKAAGRNWGAVLKTVKDELDRRWPTSTDRMSGDGEFFDGAYAALAAMQNPWRNATMHLDQIYTPEDARHLNEVIKGFMRKIASRCDENGLPKA
jgi:hypothetical protein